MNKKYRFIISIIFSLMVWGAIRIAVLYPAQKAINYGESIASGFILMFSPLIAFLPGLILYFILPTKKTN